MSEETMQPENSPLRDANGFIRTLNKPRYSSEDKINAGVDTCIAFMFGVVGFLFSVALTFSTPLGLIAIVVSLFFCLFFSYRAHDNGGNFGIGALIVAADIAFLIGWLIMALSSVGP